MNISRILLCVFTVLSVLTLPSCSNADDTKTRVPNVFSDTDGITILSQVEFPDFCHTWWDDEPLFPYIEFMYRKIEASPESTLQDLSNSVSDILDSDFENGEQPWLFVGNTLCPHLFSEQIAFASDEDVEEAMSVNQHIICKVKSDTIDDFTVRCISLYFNKNSKFPNMLDSAHYTYVQFWNDKMIGVQPISEYYGGEYFNDVGLRKTDDKYYLILTGRMEYYRGYVGDITYTYYFEDGKWIPCTLDKDE